MTTRVISVFEPPTPPGLVRQSSVKPRAKPKAKTEQQQPQEQPIEITPEQIAQSVKMKE
jgi:hypothetical protein